MTHKMKPARGLRDTLLSFFKAKPAQAKPRHTGKTIMAAMARYEQQQAEDNGVEPSPFAQQNDAPVSTKPRRQQRPKRDWLAPLRPLFTSAARWTKPNRTGKKVLAALARHNGTPHVPAQRSQQTMQPIAAKQPVSIKKMLLTFRDQAADFTQNHRKVVGGAVAATCLIAIIASSAFSPVKALSSFDTADAPQTISISPLVVQDGGLDTPPALPLPTPTEPDEAPIVLLTATLKIPVLNPTRVKGGTRVHVGFNAPAIEVKAAPKATVAKPHKHSGQTKASIAKYQAKAIGLFAEAKGLAGKLDNAANNKAALFKYMKASDAAQRGGIMASNTYVKNMHVEWAKMYMGVNGIPKNLKLAAQIALTAGKDNPATQSILNEIFVTDPDVLIKIGGLTEPNRSSLHPAGKWSSRAVSLHSTL